MVGEKWRNVIKKKISFIKIKKEETKVKGTKRERERERERETIKSRILIPNDIDGQHNT